MTQLHPYWPLIPGTYIDYQVFDITGACVDGNFWVSSRAPHANSPQRITAINANGMRGMVYHNPHTPPTVRPGNTIYEAKWNNIVGEVAGTNLAELPPIPLLDDSLKPGQSVSGSLPVVWFSGSGEPLNFGPYHYKIWKLHEGQPWAQWPDTTRITLLEDNPDPHPKVVIAYVWQRDLGLVNFWRGILHSDGEVTDGHEYYCIGSG